jgi:membrane fusion protein, multidrug efflux system
VDGSQTPSLTPPLKFDKVDYQSAPFVPKRTKRATDNKSRRKRLLMMLGAVVLFAGVGYGTYWYAVGRHYESTNDAYLGADSVTIAPKVSGYVTEVAVGDNQRVKAGDVLARIDPRDYQTALDSANADLENAQATAANIDAQIKEQEATVAQAQAALAFSDQESKRYNDLARTGAGSMQRQQQAQSDLDQRRAALTAQQAHIAVLKTQRKQADATIAAKQASLDQAKINLSQTTLTAPVDGVVGDRSVRMGQLVQPGTRLLTVVPTQSVYLVANFKETQTGQMRRGQSVTVDIDSYPGHPIKGTVDSLAPGTGAQFALLPPENATGNFTKIVQRVPVKIVLDPKDPITAELRPGLSVTATVDTRKQPTETAAQPAPNAAGTKAQQ